ncbi:LptF/LptG family permease [bacterium]|nr:LptF/LptG family permease [bacterium]
MKKLHLFILKSYLGPLLMTFLISLFILVMQFLWKYVDDMVGKGLEITVLGELLFYASLRIVPMALPLAILLASLMSFGNLGENYELTAIKAAGISLPRIMAPLIIFTVFTCYGAFEFSNRVLPYANLKFISLLHSVKATSPELQIKEKVFFNEITNYSIKIERKSYTSNMMYGIMIYNHSDNSNVTLADSGMMQISEDKKHMRLTLYDGIVYDEKVSTDKKTNSRNNSQGYRVDKFKKQVSLAPMSGQNFTRNDEDGYKSDRLMKNIRQLENSTDTLLAERDTLIRELKPIFKRVYFSELEKKSQLSKRNNRNRKRDEDIDIPQSKKSFSDEIKEINTFDPISADSTFADFSSPDKLSVFIGATRNARDTKNAIDSKLREVKRVDKYIVKHNIEWHRKFTLSFACFIFFFIGAPLGAIIRKGGLGMPVVISIFFFIFYYIVDTFGLKTASEHIWPVPWGMWLSSLILFPIGVFLTYKSANDSALLNSEAYIIFFQKVKAWLKTIKNSKKSQ